jgi:hypothetical protein
VLAALLFRLFSFTREERYYERAEQVLRVFQSVMKRNPYGTSAMLCALDWHQSQPKEIIVVGSRGNPMTEALLTTVHQRYLPNRTVLAVDETKRDGGSELSLAAGKTSIKGSPAAYVCHRQTCSQAVTEPRLLETLL